VIVARLHEAFRDRVLIFITHDETVSHMADEVWRIENGALSVVAKEVA
jgi:ABC-type transport system involved in cytochrome bd biosynthesis fused ATPase/permease subunit